MNPNIPIAITGMSLAFPGAVYTEAFWENIVHKIDTCGEIPDHRWLQAYDQMTAAGYVPDKAVSKRACLIHDFSFDPSGFHLDPDFLISLDPLYHLLLHAGRGAFNESRLEGADKEKIGVVLAAIALPTDSSSKLAQKILGRYYQERIASRKSNDSVNNHLSKADRIAAKVTSFPGSILAAGLGLKGGSYTLDAACASSLYAVKLACDELQSYRRDAMLAGGVSRPDCVYTQVGFSQLRALSPSGRCAPFDAGADGLVVGEGAGILVLKRLEDAIRHGNTIYGVIRGIGLSNDTRGNLLAPETDGQVRAMKQAYDQAGWQPQDIHLIECHGTGTPVGDLTELHSLRTLWGNTGWRKEQCAIGSIKSMIGHLLTAAGCAGLIKILLALRHRTLPPSLHFTKPAQNSPLIDSPFRVQTTPESWDVSGKNRRAAVSAFGFGGINAHILIEEWNGDDSCLSTKTFPTEKINLSSSCPAAIVGMDTIFGKADSLRSFQETLFRGETVLDKRPADRWKGTDRIAVEFLENRCAFGAYLESISFPIAEFHIPPTEIPDILPQQLLLLMTASNALKDAGLDLRKEKLKTGAVIGIEFDYEATNFHVRWKLNEKEPFNRPSDLLPPPLTSVRTVGNLGGIVASRAAKEFRIGGPCFTVSCDAASGMKAIDIGLQMLCRQEADAVLIGAVDLAGDIRNIAVSDAFYTFSESDRIHAFDKAAKGTLPGEGSAAIVLKRLDDAIRDGNKVYAVIKGIGTAGSGPVFNSAQYQDAIARSLSDALDYAGVKPESIDYIEAAGIGSASNDSIELEAIINQLNSRIEPCAVGSVKPIIGHTGACAGLASVIKTALCLYHSIIPPLKGFESLSDRFKDQGCLHFPIQPSFWFKNRSSGHPRMAAAGCITADGISMHLILEQTENPALTVQRNLNRPLGYNSTGLFTASGNTPDDLAADLNHLASFIQNHSDLPLEQIARLCHHQRKDAPSKHVSVSIAAHHQDQLMTLLKEAQTAVLDNIPKQMLGKAGIAYSPNQLGKKGQTAFVFPGSGNHYPGMTRGICVEWSFILHEMDAETLELKSQMVPHRFVPWRSSWTSGWETDAAKKIETDPLSMIFGQVLHGEVVSRLIRYFGVTPTAVIGYSLGESAGYFSMGVWKDKQLMLNRMRSSDLFKTSLTGSCNAVKTAWHLTDSVVWQTAVVNRPASAVREIIQRYRHVRLLIINTPDECVIGGLKHEVNQVIRDLKCEAIFLEGITTVHCDAVIPVQDAYRSLHLFQTTPPDGIRFYSCALCRSFNVTEESAADSILNQALHGFDFPALIHQAYDDGVRLFLEMGPQNSCSRMIHKILEQKPHLAISADAKDEDDYLTILKFLGTLIAEGVSVNLDHLYGDNAYPETINITAPLVSKTAITIPVGGLRFWDEDKTAGSKHQETDDAKKTVASPLSEVPEPYIVSDSEFRQESLKEEDNLFSELIQPLNQVVASTAEAHQQFLDLSQHLIASFGETYAWQTELFKRQLLSPLPSKPSLPPVAFDRNLCMEFAIGSAEKVLGKEFAALDTYPVRVRLPDEPLMLVDRILHVEGVKGSLGSGRVVTEHDVFENAWYLDGGRAPVCISVEAGQADLFLCSYLGIDLAVKGTRAYRLLDATVTFHRGLPQPGDTIRYEIDILRFVRQGETWLFFFQFDGYIGESHLITMRNGCAGFFTEEEIQNSGGIILTENDFQKQKGILPADWTYPVAVSEVESYDDTSIDALRHGNLFHCFGSDFKEVVISESLRLPGGRMTLIHRVIRLDPAGGRYGIGLIQAEADIHPDDWFLTCHFMDDRVMPGTLMYECCAHTLRVFLQRIGWVTDKPTACYEPLIGVESILKCRGPVTPKTKTVVYEVEIKELGYNPEPYAVANALMTADGRRIVKFDNLTLKLSGVNKEEIDEFWNRVRSAESAASKSRRKPVFTRRHILEFAYGKPSIAFGEPYQPFDSDRFIARLPSPPYSFLDRVMSVEPPPWVLKPDGWVEAEYDIPPDEWYFRSERTGSMPFCVILEIALQLCGWLAAYAGSALRSPKKLQFRNLGGKAALVRPLYPNDGTLTIRSRMTQISEAADMIIEHFDMQILKDADLLYDGTTYFGFFTPDALAQQIGVRGADKDAYRPSDEELKRSISFHLPYDVPISPDDRQTVQTPLLTLPSAALLMIDDIEYFIPDGGPFGLGFIRGVKRVRPDEWFFKAHFYQDPVWPGSLGIEAFIQLLKVAALYRWRHLAHSHRFEPDTSAAHQWMYRGQVLQKNKKVEVDAVITSVTETPVPTIFADGYLRVDGLTIYKMEQVGVSLTTGNF